MSEQNSSGISHDSTGGGVVIVECTLPGSARRSFQVRLRIPKPGEQAEHRALDGERIQFTDETMRRLILAFVDRVENLADLAGVPIVTGLDLWERGRYAAIHCTALAIDDLLRCDALEREADQGRSLQAALN